MNKIKQFREKKKLTQQQLADRIGCHCQQISMYERGERNPKIAMLNKIAKALAIDVSKLL